MRIIQEKEEKNNGAYGSRSRSGYRLDRGNTVRDDKSLDTPDRRTSMYRHHSSSSFKRHHHNHHCHHPYRRRDYLPQDFKKVMPTTFDGKMKNLEDAEAWLLGILHNYSKNMKSKIVTSLLKGKQISGGKM